MSIAEAPGLQVSASVKINGRYRLVRKLGKGGMGAVYLVLDGYKGDTPLALKRVRGDKLDKKAVALLRNEYMALAGLQHPGLARVYDFGVDRETSDYFFTSEFVDGTNLLRACQRLVLGRKEDLASFLDVIAQFLRALEYIHSRSLVHGDLKPENILVTAQGNAASPQPCVKLIDFGLTRREKEFGGKKVIGTTYYIAPETITGSQVDRRTDLYSLGAVLYQLVTGKVPFEGNSNTTVLKGHVERIPDRPSSIRSEVPAALDEIILRLLEKRPADRYESALAVLDAIRTAFGMDMPLETAETAASYLHSTQLIDRDQELRVLYTAFASACRVEGMEADLDLSLLSPPAEVKGGATRDPAGLEKKLIHLIRGEKGIGKRRLAMDLKKLVETQGGQFVIVECSQNDAANPHQDFLALMRELLSLARIGGERPQILMRVASLVKAPQSTDDVPKEAQPLFRELALYLLRLSRFQPLVIHCQDLHLGGRLLTGFLSAIVTAESGSEEAVPSSRVFLSASTLDRIDCENTSLHGLLMTPLFRKAVCEICLNRLDSEGVTRLLAAMFAGSSFPQRFVDRVFEESDGNPGVIRDVCEFYLKKGALTRTLDGWSLDTAYSSEAVPGRVRHELKEKIEALPDDALKLAFAFACLGDSTPLDLAVRLSEIPRQSVLESMQTLYRKKIVREDTSSGQINVYSFVHTSAKDMLYNMSSSIGRKRLHDRAGAICEEYYRAQGKSCPEKLAVHFLRAENRSQGIKYGLEAAAALAARLQHRKALALYSGVLSLAGSDEALASRVHYEMARVHHALGEYRKALEILEPMESGTRADGTVPAPAQVLVDLAATHTRLGNFRQASGCLDRAFAIESAQVISGWMVHILIGYANLHLAMGRHDESLRSCERVLKVRGEVHDVRLLSRLYSLLAENHLVLENREAAAKHCEEALRFTDSRSDIELLETNLWFFGLLYKSRGKLSRAQHQFERVAALRKRRGAADAHADALREMAAIDLLVDRPRQAVQKLEQAFGLHEKSGNASRAAEALVHLAEGRRLLGEYEDARNAIADCLRRGKALGSHAVTAAAYLICGRISLERGEFDNAERYFAEAEKETGADDTLSGEILEGRLRLASYRGDFRAVLDLSTKGYETARKRDNRTRMAFHLKEKAVAYLTLGSVGEARKVLVSLFDAVRRIHFKVLEGRTHLLQGMILAREGGWDRAVKSFQRAEELFKEEGSERDLIQAYVERGWALLKIHDHDHAFLAFDEGLYLSKKLGLLYWKCRLQYSIGVLEATVENGDLIRAEECFRVAERHAKQAAFKDILWQAQLQLGNLLRRKGREEEGLARLDEAIRTEQLVMRDIPEPLQAGYAAAWDVKDLENARAGPGRTVGALARGDAPAEAAAAPAPGPGAQAPEQFPALIGRSEAMEKLRSDLAALPGSAAWIWLIGPPGAGKRAAAAAIHAHHQPRYGQLWLENGRDLEKEKLAGLLADIDRVREEMKKEMPWWYRAALEEAAPGDSSFSQISVRFTLIVGNADRLPPISRRALVERVRDEEKSIAGLKVLATMDTGSESNAAVELALVATGTPVVRVPPLAGRTEDIEPLALHFLGAGREGAAPVLSPAALERLRAHDWPGNVAELRAVCERIGAPSPAGEAVEEEAIEKALAAGSS
jgi:tetratricopeptide (TPR) repeat protein